MTTLQPRKKKKKDRTVSRNAVTMKRAGLASGVGLMNHESGQGTRTKMRVKVKDEGRK